MHELTFSGNSKHERYQEILPQIEALISDETNFTANLANTTAVLKEAFGWLWVGFYLVEGNELVLGPFQGPPACTRIEHGRGVCGQSWARKSTIIVPDVLTHPGHIACSSRSRSEIVLPLANQQGEIVAVLDIDADTPDHFDQTDAEHLQAVMKILARQHFQPAVKPL